MGHSIKYLLGYRDSLFTKLSYDDMAPKKGQGGKGNTSKKSALSVPDSEHIVFSNKPDSKKKKPEAQDVLPPPPRPDTRKIIGGASWTGKLPVNLLSEHCQKQKWNKPEYSMRQKDVDGGAHRVYRSSVTLSKTDPKSRETISIPPFQLPASHVHLADQSSALEARHFAATYALFRVSSMKNVHMSLPPHYRDLWKGDFELLKKEDVKEDRGWKYDADPFAADAKRKEIQASIEKRKAMATEPSAEVRGSNSTSDGLPKKEKWLWERAPRLDLGHNIRLQIETLIRTRTIWNPNAISLTNLEREQIVENLSTLGFRPSHIKEAVEYCGGREETLEWLLIHVPEEDLPSWCLPQRYNVGVSLASGDIAKDAKIRRLAMAGYSTELCEQALHDNHGNEEAALEALQLSLVPSTVQLKPGDASPSPTVWEEELSILEAILAERFTSSTANKCKIESKSSSGQTIILHFQKPSYGYPMSAVPIIVIEAVSIPAYIRLSATRQAVTYAQTSLIGDQMIFSLLEWIEASLPQIMDDPGRLVDLDIKSVSLSLEEPKRSIPEQAEKLKHPAGIRRRIMDDRSESTILKGWKERQNTPEQVKMNKYRRALPAWSQKSAIVQAVNENQVTLITGETGSGKSTQAIQFILDSAISQGQGLKTHLICTQPRRVAALSLSSRVSQERCTTEGDEVGYIIRGDSKISQRTKITFMTTGVLLRRLNTSQGIKSALQNISHIFIDEVHERSLDTDFLLALLRDALKQVPKLKIVLMSATLNADIFANYFGGDGKVARIHIEGRTFPVQDIYLDDVVKLVSKKSQFMQEQEMDDFDAAKVIRGLGSGINYGLILSTVEAIHKDLNDLSGSILIFLPGTMEIDRCLESLKHLPYIYGLPLHASLLPSEQKKVFLSAPKGKRKVIAATNVAETSITIEDIVAVIDTGRVKETRYDVSSNIVRLEEVWASQAACKQRRGRAGRVQAGNCYKLFTKNVESAMSSSSAPEMHRVPLEQLCLSVKASSADIDISTFLSRTISPPDSGAVSNAISMLHQIGALEGNQLTGLGTYLSLIPADLRCAKLLVYGILFQCLENCLTIASILTVKSPFVSPREKQADAKAARLSFPTSDGDLLLDSAAFDQWKHLSSQLRYRDVQDWCSSKFLSQNILRDIDSTRRQLLDSLKETGLVSGTYVSRLEDEKYNQNRNNSHLLRAIIAGALHPQVAEIKLPDKKYIASMSGAKELDPEAKTIKYFNKENGRVFVHPSSILFDAQSFTGTATYISYFTKLSTSKNFIRDLTRKLSSLSISLPTY